MADEQRRTATDNQPIPQRQGVREPQPLDRGVESDRPERKVGDKVAGEGRDGADREESRDPERARGEPAEGPREPQEPRTTHVD